MNRVVEQLLDRAAKAEATEEERTLAAVFEANARRIRLADGLYREIHEVLNTTLRLLPSALGRLSAMAANSNSTVAIFSVFKTENLSIKIPFGRRSSEVDKYKF